MAATEQLGRSKKRKQNPSVAAGKVKGGVENPNPKQRKRNPSDPLEIPKNPQKPNKTRDDSTDFHQKLQPKSHKELRLAAKEMAEARKKKRNPNYNLYKELAKLWEKMRSDNIGKEERSKFISEALQKMNGRMLEIATSHVSARVLQTCIKYCSQAERDTVFEALRPHLLTLSRKKYAVHLVKKVLDNATKKQLEEFISSLHGHVASLLRHTVGSAVVEHAFLLGNGTQKQRLLVELYSTELQLFKDLTLTNSGRLEDIISKLGLQKPSVLKHMTSVIQPILEKGIVDYSIIHTALVEYLTIADRSSAADVIQQLSSLLIQESSATDDSQQFQDPELPKKWKNKRKKSRVPLLVRMMHTRDGLKIGIICIKHGNAKERKKVVKGIKQHIGNLALDQYGSLMLICILSVVDDTKLVRKMVIEKLKKMLKELVLDRNGRRPILQLLRPLCTRYFSPVDLACLNLSVPSLCSQGEDADANSEALGKKDPSLRRYELLVGSQLAESLIETCIENVDQLLRSNFGREVIYEVAVGGADGILQSLADKLDALHKAIASTAALPKINNDSEAEAEHVLENFHSSRTIRKLILDSPAFAATLWKTALQGKCEMWAQGHSCKVVTAFLESSDSTVRDLASSELQPLRANLKVHEKYQIEKEA